jgi:hypothetical protein
MFFTGFFLLATRTFPILITRLVRNIFPGAPVVDDPGFLDPVPLACPLLRAVPDVDITPISPFMFRALLEMLRIPGANPALKAVSCQTIRPRSEIMTQSFAFDPIKHKDLLSVNRLSSST